MTELVDAISDGSGSQNESFEDEEIESICMAHYLNQQLYSLSKGIKLLKRDLKQINLVFIGLGANREAVVHLCNNVLNVPITTHDICHILCPHRLHHFQSHNAHPPFIVRFCCKSVRDEVYRSSNTLAAYNESKPVEERIFVHEDLTSRNRKIMEAARRATDSGQLADTWTNNGYVFVKCNQGGVHFVKHMSKLLEITNERV